MNMLPNGEIVSNDETEYKGMLSLIDKEENPREEYIIDDQVGLGPVVRSVHHPIQGQRGTMRQYLLYMISNQR